MLKIAILGAGNAAFTLGKAFIKAGVEISQIYSSNAQQAKKLAQELLTFHAQSLEDLIKTADLYLLAVPDKAIEEVAKSLHSRGLEDNPLVLHLSGNSSLDLLSAYFPRCGVFYPLQSLKYGTEIDFGKVPFVLEANLKKDELLLRELAGKLSDEVLFLSHQQRKTLHLAAVLSNNFVNLLYKEAFDLCEQSKIPTRLLLPLIKETCNKTSTHHPRKSQTGPAIRKDIPTLLSHLALLQHDQELCEIYSKLSLRINPELKIPGHENSR
jgi:predicted short-subunit dehydrogenase-like oxidoreductase (DUF2520 family)